MLKIKNAYENNLKNINLEIPLNQIVSIIGVSGSGKSTLIYDVIANEAKRREKIDSGNATCLDFAIRAKFDDIQNLPYTIILKQRGLKQAIISTIATITKLSELLREEFVKYGEIKNEFGEIIYQPTGNTIINFLNKFYKNEKFECFAVLCMNKKINGIKEFEILNKNNINEIIVISSFDDKEKLKPIKYLKKLNNKFKYTILIPIEKLSYLEKYQNIAFESFIVRNKKYNFNFANEYFDIKTGKFYQKKSIHLLSFNATNKYSGKCEKCDGKGKIEAIDWDNLVLKDKNLNEYFLNLEDNGKGAYKYVNIRPSSIQKELLNQKIDLSKNFYELSQKEQEYIKSLIKDKILKHQNKPSIGKFVTTIKCPECNGTRLNYKANAVKLYGKSISEILALSIDELYTFLENKELSHKKIIDILKALKNATLGYLTLDRTTDTLSGGELQRLQFAIELIGEYKNLLYILDEPSNGLHPYNNYQMIELIKSLKDKGNSVIISEHNNEYIKNSDYIIKLGPDSGINGGEVVFSGTNKKIEKIEFKREKRLLSLKNSLNLENVNINNIKNENFIIPLGGIVAITGISGSGKSSLIHKALVPCIKSYLSIKEWNKNIIQNIKNIEHINDIVELTQSAIGNNSRSIVATYLDIFDEIRTIYASLDVAKELEFDKSYFSFNSDKGACPECKGMGEIDGIICHSCLGNRYKPEILEIRFNDLNIIEFLNLTIDELQKLSLITKLHHSFEILQKVGLGHLTLGRITSTLSGGEAQRLKLTKVLSKNQRTIQKGNVLFIFDEPTTGLNVKDINKLYEIFDDILNQNNSIIIIEHNLAIIKNSDYIIDIGIGSGKNGGKNIFSGTFDDLLKHKNSLTAKAFRGEFEKAHKLEFKYELKEKIYNFDKSKYPCHPKYLDDNHFLEEKQKAQNYKVITDDKSHKYFKTKKELFEFTNNLEIEKIYFNPYVSDLFKYKIVPISIKKERIKALKKLKFKVNSKDYLLDEWDYRVELNNIEKAYNFGKGWITIQTKNETFELFTRVISIKQKIIGSSKIDEKTFNVYLNSCIYCNGDAKLYAYDENLIINDKDKSILDKGFLRFDLKLNLKTIIKKFKDEGLFDFTKSFNELKEEEKHIFLFGFKEYEFLKRGGRINAKSDYIRWEGVYKYIYENLNKIEISNKIIISKHLEKCLFCSGGFKNEILLLK